MSENSILFINGPINKYIRQVCKCEDSHCVEKSQFGKAIPDEKGIFKVAIEVRVDICDICLTPYDIWYDVSNVVKVTNIGDFK